MRKLHGILMLAGLCTGCVSHARPRAPEVVDPAVGDLRCVPPPISVIDALYRPIDPAAKPAACEATRS